MDPLTRRQQDVLNYIADVRTSRGSSPLLREIAAAFGISIGRVQKYIHALRKKGHLVVQTHEHRGIRLTSTRKEWRVRQEWRGDFEKRIGARLKGETDLAKIYSIVRGDLRAWLDIDRADLLVCDADRRELRESTFFGVPSAAPAAAESRATSAVPSLLDTLAGKTFRRRRPVVTTETEGAKEFLIEQATRPGLRACAAVPILGRLAPVGVLVLDDRRRADGFDEGRLTRAVLAAEALAPALEQGALHADLQRRIRLQAALIALCRTINTRTDLQKVLHDVYGLVGSLVDSPVFIIAVKDDSGQWWLLLMTDLVDGKPWEDNKIQRGTLSGNEALLAIQTQPFYILHRTPQEIDHLEEADRNRRPRGGWYRMGSRRRSRSFLYVPLKTGGKMIGYISAQSYRFNAFSIQDAENLILIGEYIGLAVHDAWRKELERAKLDRADRILDRTRRFSADFAALLGKGAEPGALAETVRRLADELAAAAKLPTGLEHLAAPARSEGDPAT